MSARLPVRVEPLPEEWWRGYLHRVATFYGAQPYSLMRMLPQAAGYGPNQELRSGLAITDATAQQMGELFRLTPHEVQGMHLSRYAGSMVPTGALDAVELDPLFPPADWRTPSWLVPWAVDRGCPVCEATHPGYRSLTGATIFHVVCLDHGAPLMRLGRGEQWKPITGEHALYVQNEVFSRLRPSTDHEAFYADLDAQLNRWGTHKLRKRTAWQRHLESEPTGAVERFVMATDRALAPGFPHYQGLTTWYSPTALQHFRAPLNHRSPHLAHLFPSLLLQGVLAPTLSDLLHGPDLEEAQLTAAAGVLMSGTGFSLAECGTHRPSMFAGDAAQWLSLLRVAELEAAGAAEDFWTTCFDVAGQLIEEGVDYRRRESLVLHEGFHRVLETAMSTPAGPVRHWLINRWAALSIRYDLMYALLEDELAGGVYTGPLDLDDFEREHGAMVRHFLQERVREIAA